MAAEISKRWNFGASRVNKHSCFWFLFGVYRFKTHTLFVNMTEWAAINYDVYRWKTVYTQWREAGFPFKATSQCLRLIVCRREYTNRIHLENWRCVGCYLLSCLVEELCLCVSSFLRNYLAALLWGTLKEIWLCLQNPRQPDKVWNTLWQPGNFYRSLWWPLNFYGPL